MSELIKPNSVRFLDAFKDIENYLRIKTSGNPRLGLNDYVDFTPLVSIAAESIKEVRHYKYNLMELSRLRNAIIHEKPEWHIVAEPNIKVVEEIEYIAGIFHKPPKIWEFRTEVKPFNVNDPISKVISYMSGPHFSQVPIYDKKGFHGLLTTNTIAYWLGHSIKDDLVSLSDTNVETVMMYCEPTEISCFLSRNATFFDAINKFEESQRDGKYLTAVLITEDGKSEHEILGIITISDLPRMYQKISRENINK